jgi:membrane peptidoglycan carboxypeptidase
VAPFAGAQYAANPIIYKSTKPDPLIDANTDAQIISLMEGVVQRGTGTAVAAVGKPIAGKTGTTSDFFDAWFVGFSPNLAAGVYVGFDSPRTLGNGEVGGKVAAPIFRDFMAEALKDQPAVSFQGGDVVAANGTAGTAAAGVDADPATAKPTSRVAKRNAKKFDPEDDDNLITSDRKPRVTENYANARPADNYGNSRANDNYGNARPGENYANSRRGDNYGNSRVNDNYAPANAGWSSPVPPPGFPPPGFPPPPARQPVGANVPAPGAYMAPPPGFPRAGIGGFY